MFRPFPAEADTNSLTPSSMTELVAVCETLPFETAILAFSQITAELDYSKSGADDLELAKVIYGPDVPIIQFFEEFLQDPRAQLLGEQHFFALQRLLIQHAPDGQIAGDDEGAINDFNTTVKRAIMATATIIAESVTELDRLDDTERWLVVLVQNGFYNAKSPPIHTWTRAWELIRIARREELEADPNYCPVDQWMEEAFGLKIEEHFALGFALTAISGVLDGDRDLRERCVVKAEAVDDMIEKLGLEERREQAVDAISAPREWFKEQFDDGLQTAMDVAWTQAFRAAPLPAHGRRLNDPAVTSRCDELAW